MKPRIIVSLAVMAIAATAAIGGTVAYFSDSEISKNNSFTAGALDLKVDSACHYDGMVCLPDPTDKPVWQNEIANPPSSTYPELLGTPCTCWWPSQDLTDNVFFHFGDVKPGDQGENTISLTTNNNDSWLCAYVQNLANADNDCSGPETVAEQVAYGTGNQTCGNPGPGQGELQDNLYLTIWKDTDCDNKLDEEGLCVEDPVVPDDGDDDAAECAAQTNNGQAACEAWVDTNEEPIGECNWITGASETILVPSMPIDSNNAVWPIYTPQTQTGTLPGGTTSCLGFAWNIPTTVGNIIQTDSVTGDIGFYIEQSRNNPDFVCPATPAGQSKVGALLSAYVAPTTNNCTGGTVTGANSIQTAIDAATAGQTVCVDTSYDRTGDNVAIHINKDNLTLAATVRGVDLDVPVVLDNNGVKVTGFDGVIGQAASPAEQAAFYIEGSPSNVVISFNTVTGGVGAAVLTTTGGAINGALISNNVFSGATQGIYTNPHTGMITIEYNDINNNTAGIGGLMGAVVRYNEFNSTPSGGEAIGTDNTFDSNIATIGFNNFLNGTRINDYGAVAIISAENNFFNTGGINQTTAGQVDFTPETAVQYQHN